MTTTTEPAAEQATRYHLGLREFNELNGLPCPVDSITLGGMTFHRYTEKVTGWGVDTKRQRVQGGYADLTPTQHKAVLDDIAEKRVQFLAHDPATGKIKVYVDDKSEPVRKYVKARIVTAGVRGYNPRPTDMRLDGWIYLAPQLAPTIFEVADPPSLASSNVLVESGSVTVLGDKKKPRK